MDFLVAVMDFLHNGIQDDYEENDIMIKDIVNDILKYI